MKKGFTLAEVLITLGIIGVVAALTMPSLISNYRKHAVETKLKKVYSAMNQAIAMSVAENGDYSNWVKDCGTSTAITCTVPEAQYWFMEYIGKNLKILKIVPQDTYFLVYLADGGILEIRSFLYDIPYYIDEKALDNKVNGVNRFMFRFMPTGINGDEAARNKGFEPYTYLTWDGTREQLLNASSYSCAQGGQYCTKLIQWDGWKISDDYPFKF